MKNYFGYSLLLTPARVVVRYHNVTTHVILPLLGNKVINIRKTDGKKTFHAARKCVNYRPLSGQREDFYNDVNNSKCNITSRINISIAQKTKNGAQMTQLLRC